MARISSSVEWHDPRIDPYDLPFSEEAVLVTIDKVDGQRQVIPGAYIRYTEDDNYCWLIKYQDPYTGNLVEAMLWEPVIAWGYYPEPYMV